MEGGIKVMTRKHYTLVKNISALVNDKSKNTGQVYVCPNCLHRFTKKQLLEAHEPDCMAHKTCRIRFPSNKIKPRKNLVDHNCLGGGNYAGAGGVAKAGIYHLQNEDAKFLQGNLWPGWI